MSRHGAFTAFMREVGDLLTHPEVDRAAFVARTKALIPPTTPEYRRWIAVLVNGIDEGDDDDAREALTRRTQLEVAHELYRGTEGAEFFDDIISSEGDDLLRERAETFGLRAPLHVPASHRWWLPR